MPNIILNGNKQWVDSASLTYEEIVALAGWPGRMLSVTHHVPKRPHIGGIVSKGQTLLLQEGHYICAVDTSAA